MATIARIAKSISIPKGTEETDGVVEDGVILGLTEGQSLGLTVPPPLAVP
jgi:hypothetical protein